MKTSIVKIKSGVIEIKSSDPFMRSFLVPNKNKGTARVNVWSNSKNNLYTVGTYLDHPKQGKTQLFRRNCSELEVKAILSNPRMHTGKGYK